MNQSKKGIQKFGIKIKCLRETIECYGTYGYSNLAKQYENLQKGPYFTDVNDVIPISQFSLHLYSPTSTSKDIEVALKFRLFMDQ